VCSAKYQRVVTGTYTELLTFAEDSQLASSMQSMSYEEMLAGMLFPGEALQHVPPARVKQLTKLRHDGTVLERKGMVRVFFTDRRLFFIHTSFFQTPSMMFDRTDTEGPLLEYNVKLSSQLEDNLYWTTVNLEKVLAQSVDCEYKAVASTTVVVLRPWWGAWAVGNGVLGGIVLAFVREPAAVFILAICSLGLLGFGVWALLTQRHYRIEPADAESNRNRKLLIGFDDPVFMELVTLECELEEDYTMAEAFEFVQGIRSVCRRLRGEIVLDSDELINTGALLTGDARGLADYDGDDDEAAEGAAHDAAAGLKMELDAAEVHKIAPPSSSRKKVDISEVDIDERRETVADIKVRSGTRTRTHTHTHTSAHAPGY
jgi:hypothetical protein